MISDELEQPRTPQKRTKETNRRDWARQVLISCGAKTQGEHILAIFQRQQSKILLRRKESVAFVAQIFRVRTMHKAGLHVGTSGLVVDARRRSPSTFEESRESAQADVR